MASIEYRYELHRNDEIVATGHLVRDDPVEVGEQLQILGQDSVVRSIEPQLGERELRLVLELTRSR